MFAQQKSLGGVKYRLVGDEQIKNYVLKVAREEWSGKDFVKYGNDLYNSEWQLKEVSVGKIKTNRHLLKTEKFQRDLRPRIKKIRHILAQKQKIPPLILRGSDLLIFDGYARWSVLKQKKTKKCLAYIGYRHSDRKL